MDIPNILNWLPGLIAVLLSLIVAWFQFRDYRKPLLMDVTGVLVAQTSGNISLVLFRLAFVNNSSKSQVVYDIVPINKLSNVKVLNIQPKFDLENQLLTYSPSTEGDLKMPISEYLLPPLDISPHQSQSKWIGYALETSQPLDDKFPYILQFEAKIFGGKTISKCHQFFSLQKLGFSDTHKRYYIPPSSSREWQIASNVVFIIAIILTITTLSLIWYRFYR